MKAGIETEDFYLLAKLGFDALTRPGEEWGSARQVEAEGMFADYAEELGLIDEDMLHWMTKATDEERLVEILRAAIGFGWD